MVRPCPGLRRRPLTEEVAVTGKNPLDKPRIVKAGMVYAGKSPDRASCCFPRICVCGKRWLCVFRAAPAKEQSRGQQTLLTWSDDEGATWTEPAAPFPPMAHEGAPGVFREAGLSEVRPGELLATLWWVDYSDPDLPLFNWETEGLLGSRIFVSESPDAGRTWKTPRPVRTGPFTGPTPPAGHVIVAGGCLALGFEEYKPYRQEGDWRHCSAMMLSADGGWTWDRHVVVGHDPAGRMFYWDQRACAVGGEDVFVVFDTFEKGAGTRPTIHARRSFGGLAGWSELWDTGVAGQPGYPLELPDGRITLVVNDRGEDPGIKLRWSEDGGRTFPGHTGFTVYAPARPGKQSMERANLQDVMAELNTLAVFGYPCQRLLPNGDILISYYAGATPDTTRVFWARVAV